MSAGPTCTGVSTGKSTKSAPVMTAFTPGMASAREASIETMRAWGCGLRSTLPHSIPGWLKSAPKRALPGDLLFAVGTNRALPDPKVRLSHHPFPFNLTDGRGNHNRSARVCVCPSAPNGLTRKGPGRERILPCPPRQRAGPLGKRLSALWKARCLPSQGAYMEKIRQAASGRAAFIHPCTPDGSA